ncbi:hypothetical protein AVDCRST_MAG92-1348 [uncultured Coleofasciculus sp.]|uniref:Uncharacterized protein n=1 Tax=uncultured Coleofasciculus sp. TaxID=1267456 RepID=A0A6J4I126_9CYAN|nr:hypothetical protein AVDCRST_MAG92-1348 [uncultured Coleofasciculus sp.]
MISRSIDLRENALKTRLKGWNARGYTSKAYLCKLKFF